MAVRTAVLVDDKDKRLGAAQVPDSTHLISHNGTVYIRTPEGIRLGGNGIGVIFRYVEPLVRNQLRPI